MKVCIIGVGRMGRRHITAAQQLGYQVVGVADTNPEVLKLAVNENSISEEQCYQSAEQMLEDLKPKTVVIATTAPTHCQYVCMAALAGVKYILCEKPMATSIAECDQMIKVCKENGAKLAINHQRRFTEGYIKVKSLCESQEFGGICSITVCASNFGLAMNASHYFEMFKLMTNDNITEVSFRMDDIKVPNPRGIQYEDHAGQIFALTGSGHRLYMEIGGDQGHGIHVVYGCRYGQIFVDELAGHVRTVIRQHEYRHLPTVQYGMPANEDIFKISPASIIKPTQDILSSLLNEKNYPDGDCARGVILALVAAHISGENNGVRVKLTDALPTERKFAWA